MQSSLSNGQVFVGRYARLAEEIGRIVRELCDLPQKSGDSQWFLSDVFFEAFAADDDSRLNFSISDKLLAAIRSDPRFFLFDYWMTASDEERQKAVRNWSFGSEQLRQRIERRRASFKDEPIGVRRKA